MTQSPFKVVVLGLSITSSWGNGHATTYRSLLSALSNRGHELTFLERDMPWYAENRDMPNPPFLQTKLYGSVTELKERFGSLIQDADLVMVGSYVPEGVEVGRWVVRTARGVTAFYDIDTPVTLAKLERGDFEYLSPELIAQYKLYLSFTGGTMLDLIEKEYRAANARVLYCSVDADRYRPQDTAKKWDLGYIGTYSADRQPTLDTLMLEPARRSPAMHMVIAGPLYPADLNWPPGIERIEHLNPSDHCHFYNSQRFTLNVTRADMVKAGHSPSVRLFEAAACGTPIISDFWEGLDTLFSIGSEILISRCPEDTLAYLHDLDESESQRIGNRARQRILENHTSMHRAAQLENYVRELLT